MHTHSVLTKGFVASVAAFALLSELVLPPVLNASTPPPVRVTNAPNGIVFPQNTSSILNVRNYGAKGDGVTDDSAAIQRALDAGSNSGRIVYFPHGTYLVSRTLYFYRFVMVQGQSERGTIIRLKDRSPGYGNSGQPRWVLYASPRGSEADREGENVAHSQYVMNLTVHTGSGNPGAIGMMFISNNGGGLREVTIRSGDGLGVIGLDLRKAWDGPALYKGITIRGFNVGIEIHNSTYSSDFDGVTLSNQRVVGIINNNHPSTFRRLTSVNAVPTLDNQFDFEGGLVVLLDSTIRCTVGRVPAIKNGTNGEDPAGLFVERLTVSGCSRALQGSGAESVTVSNNTYSIRSHPLASNWTARAGFLYTPVPDTPLIPWDSLQNWVSVGAYEHLVRDGNWAPAIQAAIDSGKSTVYFPGGSYYLNSPIEIRGNVKVFQGASSVLVAGGTAFNNRPMIRVASGTQPVVFIDRMIFDIAGEGSPIFVEHASSKDLVITHSRGLTYRNASGTTLGRLFVDDMTGGTLSFPFPQKAYFRQINIEGARPKIINVSADIWIQGMKSEGVSTLVENRSDRAKTVVLGGLDYPANDSVSRDVTPSFINNGGTLSVVMALFWTNTTLVRETIGSETRNYRQPPGTRFLFFSSVNPNHR